MGRRSGYDYRKNRKKSLRKKYKRFIVQNSIIRKSWNDRLSVRANFNRIGLVFDPNETTCNTVSRKEEVEGLADPSVIRELKNMKKSKRKRERFISEDDRIFCIYLLELYGEDYGAMCRDSRNVYQLTPTQIERMIRIFRESKYYPRYLKDKSDNNLHVLELYE
ncbi:Ribosome biolocus tagsis protein Nop16 [Echinococcus multilocularis]|uniref:Nucleolar protein 16 n=1 Tax=Echinococcus multilocularis TaxID=6211 RepID=A0A068Y6M0_ECHMU|nr:Ribosome biolocus tagsis protein Nop16 [Echinococcus multilocularis]